MAVVEDRDNKTHSHSYSHDQNISTSSSITMSKNYTKDLFNKFMAAENHRRRCNIPLPTVKPVQRFDTAEEMDEEDFELSLGLSMNGRFGFDPNTKKIKRTTSIPESMIPVTVGGGSSSGGSGGGSSGGGGGLMRTCSLPVENEEEWRKRKELQSQRRMEARKKRYEKQRNSRAMRERSFGGSGGEGGVGSESGSGNSNNLVEVFVQGVGGESLIRTSSLTTRVGGLGLNGEKELDQVVPPSPQDGGGSIGSSSGTSESEGQQHGQGTTPMDTENSVKVAKLQNKTKDFKNLFEDMPSVTTKGEGPNGKKIEGFLYKYGKGEEVRILCVCHGSFLTPAEFVKHAGGGDVTNPLKHIVVNSSLI